MRFKYSLFYPILSILIIVAGSTLFIGFYLNENTLRETLEAREANKARDITYWVTADIQKTIKDISTLSQLLKQNDKLANGLIQYNLHGEVKPLQEVMDSLYPTMAPMGVDVFLVTDNQGKIAYQASAPGGGGGTFKAWGLEEALAGENILETGYGPQGWAIRAMAPLSRAGKQSGVLILGIRLDDAFARKIGLDTQTHISFTTPYQILASSWPPAQRQQVELPWVIRSVNEKRSFFHVNKARNTSSFYEPMEIGDETVCLVINTDTTPIYNLLEQKKKHLFLSFFGVLVVILGVGSGLTFSIVSPLRSLQQRALAVIRDFSQEDLAVARRGNEIETLSQAMEVMLGVIQARLTDLEAAHEALQERETFLASVFASIQDGIVVMDRDLTIIRANPSEEHQFRHDLPMVGRKCYELRHGRSHPCEECPCRQAMETGKTAFLLKKIKREGKTDWVETFAFPLQDLATGQVTGVIEYIRDVSERKQAEEALQEVRRDWEEIFQAIGQPTFLLDQEQRITAANRAALTALGGPAAEILGRRCYELLHYRRDDPAPGCPMKKLLDSGEMETMEMEVEALEGTYLVSCTPVFDDQGTLKKVIHIATDITARKRVEEALRETQERLRLALQGSNTGLWDWDLRTDQVYFSPEWKGQLGYADHEISHRYEEWESRLHPDDRESALAALQEYFDDRSPEYDIEFRLRHKDGTYRWINARGAVVKDAAGKPYRMMGCHIDITERQQAEEALSKSHRELRETAQQLEQSMNMLQLVLESIPVRVFWKDKDLRYLGCNTLFARDAGLSRPEQILGLDDFALGWREQAELYRADDRQVMESGLPRMNIIEPQTTPEGDNIWLNTSKVPLQTPNGEVFGVLGVYEDITARKRAEEALAEEAIRRRILVEQSRDGIVVLDETGKVYEANQRYAEMLGYSAAEVSQLYVWDWDAQWTREELLEQIRRVDDAGDHFETRHRRRDGTIFEVEISTNGVVLGGQKLVFCVCRDISQRKAAERALRESEEKYRLLVNQIPAVVFRGYADWSLETFDRKIEDLTGYPKEDFDSRRRKWADLILEEDLPQVRANFLEGLKATGTYLREYRIRKKSGKIIWVQVHGRIFLDAAGRIDYISGVIFDVTARKKAEEALLKYEFIANTAKDCMTLIDRNYLFEAANAAYCQAHGKTREEVVGQSVAAIWGQDTFDSTIKSRIDQCFAGQGVEYEGWFAFGQRGRGCYRVSYNPYFNEDGTVAYVAVVSHDITNRKRAEEELRKERDLSISIIESLPGVFYLFDEPGRLRRWNKNLEEISQYSALEILGMHPQDFFTGQDKTRIEEAMLTAFAAGEARVEAELVSKDGGKTPYLFTGRRLIMEDRPFLVGMGLDISQRRQMEEALKKRLVALSRPLDEAGDLNFDDLFNLEEIQQIQDRFAEITGVASNIATPEGTPITRPSHFCRLCRDIIRQTELGRQNCAISDARTGRICHEGPNMQHCLRVGMCNASASISVGGKHIANWLIGQVRDGTENEESLRDYARDLGVDEEEFITAFFEVPVMSPDQFKKVAQALFVLANQLSAMAYQNVQQARFITERQRAEEALRESEKRFRDIADNALEWIWEVDAQGKYTYSNSMVEELLGYKPEEILNLHFYDLFHFDDREELTPKALEVLVGKMPFREFINRNIHKDGREVWLSTSGVPIFNDHGDLVGYRGADTDITERLKAEKALQESESFLASVFASIQDFITILDKDLNIVRVNPAREQALPPEGPLVGKKCYEVLHHTSHPCEDCSALRTMETGQPTQRIVTLKLAEREGLRQINLSTFPLIDASGQVTGVVEVARDITEQKQAEEAIRERESMLSLVINTVPQVIFWKDLNSVYLGCNQNYAQAAGLEAPAAIVGKTEFDLPWRPEETETYLAEDREVMQTKQAKHHQVETRELADGRQIWVDGTKMPLLAADDTVIGVLGVYEDVTERKKMEEELRESEVSYRTLAQNLPGLVYRVFIREGFRMEFYNDLLESMTGYTLQELCQSKICSLDPYILPEDREKVSRTVKQAVALDQVFEVEYRFRHKDGSVRYFAERGKPIPGEDGQVSHIDGVIWDITAAKHLEAAVQESERRFRGLVEHLPMGIMIIQDGGLVYQNPEQERLFGHLHIENCHDLLLCAHPQDVSKAEQFCRGIMANLPQADTTLRFIPLDSMAPEKRSIWVNCRGSAIDYRGRKAMLINMVDITRTKELEQLMLIREKMASLGQVAAGIAHEIRNPLSGINVFLDGIKENFQDPENTAIVQELIEAAQATSNRIEAVIRRVLDFSRPGELRLAPTNINLAVDNAIKLTATSLRKEDIRIDRDLATGLPLVPADLHLLEQALVNMITNASEALRGTGAPGRIQISTHKTNGGVMIAVNDSGPGIPPEIRDKIFDPFFTTKSDGSGIGLSLCHRIITDHGGTIEVSASDLGGTEFLIHLFGK